MTLFSKSKFLSVLTNYCFKRGRSWFSRSKQEEVPFVVVRARQDEYDCIVDLLWKYYYPEEPTTLSIGLGYKYNPVFDDHALKDLSEGLTLIAKCKYTGEIVGGSINKTACPWDPDLTEQLACTLSCPKTKQLYQFYAYLQRAPCLWERYNTNKIFEISQLFVKKVERGRGVGALLTQASRRFGADCGYKVVRLDATSEFSACICEKLNMCKIHEIPYCSYTGHGPLYEPVFKPPPPHTSCKIYIDVPPYT